MATLREGNRCALVVVDAQVGVLAECWDTERVVGNIAAAVQRARDNGVPVIWVQHQNHHLPHGSDAWQWAPALVPADGEARVDKLFNSAFEQTPLEALLAAAGVSRIVLAGAATNWCIRATAYAALDRGYDLDLLADAHTTGELATDSGPPVPAEALVRDLNTVMTWLEYPGRRSAAPKAADVDFNGSATGPAPAPQANPTGTSS